MKLIITRETKGFKDSKQCINCKNRYKNGKIKCGNVVYLRGHYYETACELEAKIKGARQ